MTHFARYIMTSRGFPRSASEKSKNSRKLTGRENLYIKGRMCQGGLRGWWNRCDRRDTLKRGIVGSQAFCLPLGPIYYMLYNEEKRLRTHSRDKTIFRLTGILLLESGIHIIWPTYSALWYKIRKRVYVCHGTSF